MSQEQIDLLRIVHLLCFALGFGAGLYFDLRALRRFTQPFTKDETEELQHVHTFVFAALFGLWITGAFLVYLRTGLELANFTPKLWVKLSVVALLTANAFGIGKFVLPHVIQSVGQKACDMPLRNLVPMTFTTALSIFCWVSGLVLGASVTFKTANWTTLGTSLAATFLVIVIGSVAMIYALKTSLRRRDVTNAGA